MLRESRKIILRKVAVRQKGTSNKKSLLPKGGFCTERCGSFSGSADRNYRDCPPSPPTRFHRPDHSSISSERMPSKLGMRSGELSLYSSSMSSLPPSLRSDFFLLCFFFLSLSNIRAHRSRSLNW